MSGIKVHNDQSPFKGAVQFANKSVAAYLEKEANAIELKFAHLQQMMQGDLYITDLRSAQNPQSDKRSEKWNQMDLVGFKENGDAVGFTLLCDEALNIKGLAEKKPDVMSDATQEMLEEIKAAPKGPAFR